MNPFFRLLIKISYLIYPYKVLGKENIPNGGAILVCNHFSFVDPLYLVSFNKKNLSVLAKKELFKKKFIGGLLKNCGGIPVDRDNPDLSTIISAIKVLKNGNKLAIFPEGTRNKSNTLELQPIKSGSAVFAVKAKCPIVPIMIERKARVFRKNHIIIGKPFELSDYYGKKLNEQDYLDLDLIITDKMKSEQNSLFNYLNEKKRKNK